jgi:thiamine biosynthesis lipoprotein
MMTVIRSGLEISRKSGGAFDLTIGPLVNLWGFGPDNPDARIPSEEKIRTEKRRTGYAHLKIRSNPPALKKNRADIYCDLAAIAKGYAVDRLSGLLEGQRLDNFLVEIGGEIRTKGKNRKNRPWKIGIASPDDPQGIHGVVDVSNSAMATSGDYRNYFEKDGIRYSHTIDPSTGYPIRHNLASVTVIAGSCMVADAMATAINVLGPEKGFDLALRENLAVYMIIRENNGFLDKQTPQFSAIMSKKGR